MEIATNLNEIAEEKAYPELTEEQKQELDNRIKDHEINPDNTMTWEEMKYPAAASCGVSRKGISVIVEL